jgi:hypothetical protein
LLPWLALLLTSTKISLAEQHRLSTGDNLTQYYARHTLAHKNFDPRDPALPNLIYTLDWSERNKKAFESEFIAREIENKRASVHLLNASLMRTDLFVEGNLQLAFLRVVRTMSDPMHPGRHVKVAQTLYALSEDAGSTWKFNVLGCFSEEWVRLAFPTDTGTPPFEGEPAGHP